MPRPEGSKEELEARRKEAVKLLERGASVPEVADLKDVTLKSVYRWKETYDKEGLEGLDAIPNTGGRDPELPEEKLPELEELLLRRTSGSETNSGPPAPSITVAN